MLFSACPKPAAYRTGLYACPRCQIRWKESRCLNVVPLAYPSLSIAQKREKSSNRRSSREHRDLSHSTRQDAIAETSAEDSTQDIFPTLRIRRDRGSIFPAISPLPKSDVRNRLRQWTAQMQAEKGLEQGSEVRSIERTLVLPNSLFVEESNVDDFEDEEMTEEDEWDHAVEGQNKLNLERGDLTTVKTDFTRKQFALFLGMVGTQSQFFLADGRWLTGNVGSQIKLSLRRFATEEEMQVIDPFLPKRNIENYQVSDGRVQAKAFVGEVPSYASLAMLQKISGLVEEVLSFRRRHVDLLESLYEHLADEGYYTTITLNEVVERVFNQDLDSLPDGAKMAIFQAVENDPIKMHADNSNTYFIPVIVAPRRMIKTLDRVVDWARQYQELAVQAALGRTVHDELQDNPLTAFVEKARRLILRSRQMRSPTTTGSLGPSSKQDVSDGVVAIQKGEEDFSDNDKAIIEFLWHTFLRLPRPAGKSKHWSVASLILRAIGAYPKFRLDYKIGRLLLQELGCLAPWAEDSDENIMFPIPGRRGAHLSDLLCKESEKLCENIGFDEQKRVNPLQDSLADIRKDLGNLQVFTVDNKTTTVVDDGYSLEAVTDQPGLYWVHVHVAHPSAYITPEHVFARRARNLGCNLYTSNAVYSMMPWSFCKTIGLANGTAALTLSTLINENGEVLDVRLVPSKVNNVIRLDRTAVDDVMGVPKMEQASMVIGTSAKYSADMEPKTLQEDVETVQKHLPTLNKLRQLVDARVKARQREVPSYANFLFTTCPRAAKVSFLESFDSTRLLRPYHYRGDPMIKIRSDRYETIGRHGENDMSKDLTAHIMILASESAGRWFKERQIPAPFSGSLTQPEFPLSKLNSLGPNDRMLLPASKSDSVPIPHVMLNVAQYLKFTSPLRRFTDMMAHWQADAYLRGVAKGVISDSMPAPNNILPFTKRMVDDYIRKEMHMIRDLDRLTSMSVVHWAFQALFRAFHFKEAELPDVWDCKILAFTSSDINPQGSNWGFVDTGIRVKLMPFGLYGVVVKSDECWEDSSQLNEYLPARIELVDLSHPLVYVRAVGHASKTYTCTNPIKIMSRRVENSDDTSSVQ